MSAVFNYIEQFDRCVSSLSRITLGGGRHGDCSMTGLIDCLVMNPNAVTLVALNNNLLTDQCGIKLAQYIASSSTILYLDISKNQFSDVTYLAIASALCVNTSIQELYMFENEESDGKRINIAFTNAIRLNPLRFNKSMWWLYKIHQDFKLSKQRAKSATSPSMLEFLLCVHLNKKFK